MLSQEGITIIADQSGEVRNKIAPKGKLRYYCLAATVDQHIDIADEIKAIGNWPDMLFDFKCSCQGILKTVNKSCILNHNEYSIFIW